MQDKFEQAKNNLLKRDLPSPMYSNNNIHHQIVTQELSNVLVSNWSATKEIEENFIKYLIKHCILKK